MLGSVAPLIVRVVAMESGIGKGAGTGTGTLLESAVLSLCKFMCVSSDFCSKHLQVCVCVCVCVQLWPIEKAS